MYCIIFVAIASFISHLFMSDKHGMHGFGMPRNISYLLNKLDILSCFIVIGRFLYLYWRGIIIFPNISLIKKICIALFTLFISEFDKYNA